MLGGNEFPVRGGMQAELGQPVKEASEVAFPWRGEEEEEEEGKGTRADSDRVGRVPVLPRPNCVSGASPWGSVPSSVKWG